LTLADLSVAAVLVYAKEAEMPLAQYPRVQEWSGRIYALPAWRETAPTPTAAAA
jgi:glutathione S-transferase